MLSFESSVVNEYGPQHSTPVKGHEAFLSKIQGGENNLHLSKTGRVAPSDVDVSRSNDSSLIHHVDHDNSDLSNTVGNSVINISNISVIKCISDVQSVDNSCIFLHDNNNKLVPSKHNCGNSKTYSNLCSKQSLKHQTNPFSHTFSQTPGILEQEQTFNRHDFRKCFQTKFRYSRAMPSDCVSDSDLFQQSLSPKANYRHDESSDMSYGKATASSSNDRVDKALRKVRSSSAPRYLPDDVGICSRADYNLPTYSASDFRRAPAVYIEQDIINKQRQEIQLLMEELGNRDQELNDLVMSHQKQVKAWESDNEKFLALQARLSQYEDELKSRENHLKETLSEMSRVNEQREVDALELKQTQNEMVKLAERIMENSVYIKEMEAQNQKLSYSLREFVNARKTSSAREQELLSVIEEKKSCLTDKQKQFDEMAEHVKYLECRCDELGERNNNTAHESINWKKKYFQVKEEADKLNAECKTKEENAQKMTQQLHESLQQAIALQKALFTSCEREKCKEEVMYSLRKQHKRTMQELQNIRELYDRLTRDNTLYHLSVKDKEAVKDGKKKEDEVDAKARKGKTEIISRHDEEAEKRRLENRRKHELNSSQKLKHPEIDEQSFLIKETKDRKQTKDDKSGDANAGKVFEKNIGNKSFGICKSKNCKVKMDEGSFHGSEFGNESPVISQKVEKKSPKVSKTEQLSSTITKSGHTTMFRNIATITSSTTLFSESGHFQRSQNNRPGFLKKKSSCAESNLNEMHSSGFGNTSRNADFHSSLTNSQASTIKSVPRSARVPLMALDGTSVMEIAKDKDGGCESSSDVSHIASPSQFDDELTPADSDGMCHELQRNMSRIDSQHLDRLSPRKETSCLGSRESRTLSNSLTLPSKSSVLRKDTTERKIQCTIDDLSTSSKKLNIRKKMVEFDANEELTKSVSMETQTQFQGPESESCSPQSAEERNSVRGNSYSQTKNCTSFNSQSKHFSPVRKKDKAFLNEAESSSINNPHSGRTYLQKTGRYLHLESESEQEQENPPIDCHKSSLGGNYSTQKSLRSCSQCRTQGKSCCPCPEAAQSYSKSANKISELEPNMPKSNLKYSCQSGQISASSKLSFSEIDSLLDYNSSLSKSQSRPAQSVERCRFQMCATPDEIKSSLFHHSDQKIYFSSPENKPYHDLSSTFSKSPKFLCNDLPERVSTYLAKHLSVKRELYNSNNSRSVDYLNSDFSSRCEIPEKGSEILLSDHRRPFQHESEGEHFEKEFVDKRESLQDSTLLCTHIAGAQDFCVVKDPEKETCIRSEKRKYRYKDATENNLSDGHNNSYHHLLSDLEDKEDQANVRIEGHQFLKSKNVGSFELDDMVCSTKGKLETVQEFNHGRNIAPKFCTGKINMTEIVCICPKEPDSQRKMESNCELDLLNVKGEEVAGLCPVTSVSTSSSQTSLTNKTRERSLYKCLSQIHFSEKTRRYEWTTQPKITSQNIESTKLLNNDMSTNQEVADFELMNLSANGDIQDISTPHIAESKLHLKFSDSAQINNSGFLSGPINRKEKQVSHSNQMIPNDASNLRCNQSGDIQLPCSELEQYLICDIPNKDLEQDLHNTNSSNIYGSLYLKKNYSPPTRARQLSQISHLPSNNWDGVVKKLDFNDTSLRARQLSQISHLPSNNWDGVVKKLDFNDTSLLENDSESSGVELCHCIQCYIPALNLTGSSLIETCESSAIFNLTSNNLDVVAERSDLNDTALQESRSATDSFETCDATQHCLPACSNGEEGISVSIKSSSSPRNAQTVKSAARTGINITSVQAGPEFDHHIRCGQKQCSLAEDKCINPECTVIINSPQGINPGHVITNGSPQGINPGHMITNGSPQCLHSGHLVTNSRPQCINSGHTVTIGSPQCLHSGHLVTNSRPRCINSGHTVTNGSPQCINSGHTVTNGSPQCINSGHTVTNGSPQCINSGHSITNGSPQCFNPGHTVTNDRPQCFHSGHTVTNDRPQCINSGHSVTNGSPQCFNSGHSVTNGSPQCFNSGHTVTNGSPQSFNSGHTVTNDRPQLINLGGRVTIDSRQCMIPGQTVTNNTSKMVNSMNTSIDQSNRLLTDNEDHSNMRYQPMHPQDISTFPSHLSAEKEVYNISGKSNGGNMTRLQENNLQKIEKNRNSNTIDKLVNINMCDKSIDGSVDIEDTFSKIHHENGDAFSQIHKENVADGLSKISQENGDAFSKIHHMDDTLTKMYHEDIDGIINKVYEEDIDGVINKVYEEDFDDALTKMPPEDFDDALTKIQNEQSCDVCYKICQDRNEVVDYNKMPLYTKDIEILQRESDNVQVIKTFDPGTSFRGTNNWQEPEDCDLACSDDEKCNKVFQEQLGTFLEDTRDSNTSIICCTDDVQDIPAWMHEDSVEEKSDMFDDTLSAFLDDSTNDNGCFVMETPLSPVTKLYKLLVESQDMIKSLEKCSRLPNVAGLVER